MKISNAARIKAVILRVLSDGEEHSFAELKAAVIEEDGTLLTAKNTMSGILYQMLQGSSGVIRSGKAMYRLAGKEEYVQPWAEEGLDALLARLREVLEKMDREIETPSYDMSEGEFAKRRKVYLLSKELHRVLDACF